MIVCGERKKKSLRKTSMNECAKKKKNHCRVWTHVNKCFTMIRLTKTDSKQQKEEQPKLTSTWSIRQVTSHKVSNGPKY